MTSQHLTRYYDINITIILQPYVDAVHLVKYHHRICDSSLPSEIYFESHDLYYHMIRYHAYLTTKGMTILPAKKVHSTKEPYTLQANNPISLHQLADLTAPSMMITHLATWSVIPHPEKIYISDMDGVVTGEEKQILETHWSLYRIEEYYITRWLCTMEDLATFDWVGYTKSFETSSLTQQRYIIKIMMGWLPVHYHLNKTLTDHRYCPLCQQDETIAHLVQCKQHHD